MHVIYTGPVPMFPIVRMMCISVCPVPMRIPISQFFKPSTKLIVVFFRPSVLSFWHSHIADKNRFSLKKRSLFVLLVDNWLRLTYWLWSRMNISMRLSERLFLDERRLSTSLWEEGRKRKLAVSTNPFPCPPRVRNSNMASLCREEITREGRVCC